ncbi:MAG: hypothetical protein CUN57_02725, partial [Phototrophicales bacterium]
MSDDKSNSQHFDKRSKQAIYNMMRQLQEHVRSNVPAMMAQRSLSSFNLSEDAPPHQAQEQILVVVYPQDPFVGEPEVRRLSVHDVQEGLVNGRFRIDDSHGDPAQPDENGNYMYLPGTPQFDQVNA